MLRFRRAAAAVASTAAALLPHRLFLIVSHCIRNGGWKANLCTSDSMQSLSDSGP